MVAPAEARAVPMCPPDDCINTPSAVVCPGRGMPASRQASAVARKRRPMVMHDLLERLRYQSKRNIGECTGTLCKPVLPGSAQWAGLPGRGERLSDGRARLGARMLDSATVFAARNPKGRIELPAS